MQLSGTFPPRPTLKKSKLKNIVVVTEKTEISKKSLYFMQRPSILNQPNFEPKFFFSHTFLK